MNLGWLRGENLRLHGFFFCALAVLIAAVTMGGASRQHELRLAIVELSALPLLALAVPALSATGIWSRHRFALLILCLVAAVPLVQLIPLPPSVWTALPNRGEMVLALDLAGVSPGWAPLSVTPDKTWRSFLALLPPLAMFVGVLLMRSDDRLALVQALLIATGTALVLAAVQVVGGDAFYLWRTTSEGAVVGFFSNRNHLATMCLMAMPFCATIAARAVRRGSRENAFAVWASAALMAMLVVMLGVIRSRTGIALAGPMLIASALVAWHAAGGGRPQPFLLAGGGIIAIAAAAVGMFALGPILERFDRLGQTEGRFENWPIVMQAADAYLPLGSGLGSFDAVFRSVEPLASLDATFFNQAHNDYLETWLETGWLGVAVLLAFFVWFGRRAWSAWRSETTTQRDLQRASSLAIGAVLLHAFVDYPLRTETIAVLLAVCCALLELASRPSEDLVDRDEPQKSRRRRAN